MKFFNVKTGETADGHMIGKTKAGNRIYINPGSGWTPLPPKGKRVRRDRDDNYVLGR